MAQAMYQIDQYVATLRKKDTIWMVFNRVYNERHALKQEIDNERYLNKEETDYEARKEFLDFMNKNYPNTKLIEVGDLVSAGHIVYPYLGSLAIDTDIDGEVFHALSERYGSPYEDNQQTNQTLWIIDYKNAKLFWGDKEQGFN